jgi:hypothetical protein
MGKKKSDGVNRAEAVRVALAEGKETPEEGVAFIKDRYGVDMPKAVFSSYKSQEKAKKNKAAGATPAKRGRPPAAATPAAKPSTNGQSNPADLARAVKSLVTQYGADAVKGMAEVFAE